MTTITNKTIYDLLNKTEEQYIDALKSKLGNKFYEDKKIALRELIQRLDKTKLNAGDFDRIRKLSISKGGFLTNSIRREIYKKALEMDPCDTRLIYYEDKSFEEKVIDIGSEIDLKTNYDYIIEVDVKRSILNTLLDREVYDSQIEFIKKDLIVGIKKYINLNDSKYHYYQGFHDIALYMHLLYLNYESLQQQAFQRLSEYYFKDYLIKIDLENMNKCNFRFEVLYQVVNDIIQQLDGGIYNYIRNNTEINDPLFALAWTLTFFTHDLKNMFITYRIFDYLLFAEPGAIFHLAANV
jgi:hypothetical protein